MNRRKEQIGIYCTALLFFLLTLSRNFSGPHDSIYYLNAITGPEFSGNHHHLLYHYSALIWFKIWHFILPQAAPYLILDSFSSLWGSGSLLVLYSLYRNRAGFSVKTSLLGLLPIAFSYGFWFYSTNIEVYAPLVFFVLLGIYIASKPGFNFRDWLSLAATSMLAILFHQVNVLFVIVVLFQLWRIRKQVPWRYWLAGYALSGVIVVVGAYFVVGWYVEGQNSPEKWLDWLRGYTKHDDYWQAVGVKTPLRVSVGFSHAVFGGHFLFQIESFYNFFLKSMKVHSLEDEVYVTRNMSHTLAGFLAIVMIVVSLCMLFLAARFIKYIRPLMRQFPLLLPPVLLTGAIYSLFFMVWMPEILEFWILQTVLLLFLLFIVLQIKGLPGRLNVNAFALFLAGSFFMINYFGTLQWMRSLENDLYFAKVQSIQKYSDPKDLILLQDSWIIGGFVRYFTTQSFCNVPESEEERKKVDAQINEALSRNAKVIILPEVGATLKLPNTKYIDSLKAHYGTRVKEVQANLPQIWVLR